MWKPILGYEQLYEVSDEGEVRRIAPWCDGRKIPIKAKRKCNQRRYVRITLFRYGKRHEFPVHRLVYEAFNGPIPTGLEINHKNGDRYDNRLDNLEAVTKSQNERHKHNVLGRVMAHGSRHWNAKLMESDVIKIRTFHASGRTGKSLAHMFGVGTATISTIINRKGWLRA